MEVCLKIVRIFLENYETIYYRKANDTAIIVQEEVNRTEDYGK